jgi:hypothetical protein
MRDADDCVGAVQEPVEAERCDQELGQRRRKVGREVSADQTRGLACSRPQSPGHTSFDVLGVELRGGPDRTGTPPLKRRPSRKKRRTSRKRVTAWCKEQCRDRRKDWFRAVHAKRRGYSPDDGGKGNAASRREVVTWARRLLCRGLKRRRQRRNSTGAGFRNRLPHVRVERPRLVGRPPTRLAAGRASAGLRPRVFLQSPVRENCTPGSVRGRSGDWPSYRDGWNPSPQVVVFTTIAGLLTIHPEPTRCW